MQRHIWYSIYNNQSKQSFSRYNAIARCNGSREQHV